LQPDRLARRQLNAARSLHLEQERIERIVDPHDLVALQSGRLASLRARVERHDLVAVETSAHSLSLELGIQRGEVDDEQVVGPAVERSRERFRAFARAAQQRLVVTGDESLRGALASRHAHDAVWRQVLLDESAHELRIAGARRDERAAERLPLGTGVDHAARAHDRGPSGERVVGAPAR
jgi:hypothetical protein